MSTELQKSENHPSVTADAILHTFNRAGLRGTRQRRVIAQRLAQLGARGTDFATEELWQELQRSEPTLGRATLFRAVDSLVDLGVLDRIELGDGTRRYRVCEPGHHHHLICTVCHRIEEVDICLPQRDMVNAARQAGFEMERHALELYGRCASCQAG